MNKKRRSEDSAESKTPVKKEKLTEFNGTVFKTMMREPTTVKKGLETFISTAKKLPCLDLYDVVEGYIKISMECAEIFKLLDVEKPNEAETVLVFESLEMILLRTASDLSHFSMVGSAIVKKMVSGHMKLLQGFLRSQNHRFVRQCLSFLSAMVSQGQTAAREVLSQIHVNRSLSELAKRKDKKGKPDVRLAYIQFVLSFLVSGDSDTVVQILEIKELLPEILNTGLKEDRMSLVNLILSTLKTRVLLNKVLSKTQKVRFFTPAVLANIASLYKWNGIVDATTDDDAMAENSEQAAIAVVRDLVHSFLLDVCCSRKHGISFHDASFGTAGRPGNIVLLQFLVGLKQATEDELVADLVVNALKANPDILARYFKETQFSYTPRLKSAWQDNVRLLKKIYEAQPEVSSVFQSGDVLPVPRLLSMILVVSLPPVCNKAFFTQGLGFSNTAVQVATLSMMSFLLKRASKNLEVLLDEAERQDSDVYSPETMTDLVQQYRETLSKILPDMTSIVSKWQLLSKKEKAGGEEKKAEADDSGQPTENKNEEPADETAEVVLLKALILQVICLYQRVVPHLVNQCKFDFSKLLKGIVSEKGVRQEVPPVLQYQILQLALELPASKFSWFRIQDTGATPLPSAEKSVLYLLLKMFVNSSSNSHLKTSTRMLVVKVLKDSGVFEYTWTELELWLDQLTKVESDQQETVVQFMEKVLVTLVCSSHTYTDKVASLVQEAANLQSSLSNQEGDAVSIPVSHIDDVLDMLDVIMEGADGEMEEFGPSLSEDLIVQTFPFSVVVPAALEARNKLSADKGAVHEYLSAVLTDVLHCQRDPLPLCLTLLQYDKDFLSSDTSAPPHPAVVHLHQYYCKWLPQPCREELFKSSEDRDSEALKPPRSYGALMKASYCGGAGDFLQDAVGENVEEATALMSLEEFPVAIKQILLYVKTTVENFGTFPTDIGAALLRTLMKQLQDLVTKLKDFEETKTQESAAENLPEGSHLFVELHQSPGVETNKEQILVSALGSIFKHPCLEQWFLAVELSAPPPHSLNPVRLKKLGAQLTDDTLSLLNTCAPVLHRLSHSELLQSYTGAVERAVLKELTENSQDPNTPSRPLQALLTLHGFMDSSSLSQVVSMLLLLPPERLVSRAELSACGRTALQILTEHKPSSPSQDHSLFLTQAHLSGLSTLLRSCSSPALETFLREALTGEPGAAKLIHTDVLLHCLRRPLPDPQAISLLLLQNSSAHRLRFELWCSEPANMEKLSEQTELYLPLINTYLQVASREDAARPKDVQKEVLKSLKKALLAKLSQCVLGTLTDESGSQFAEALASLIRLSANARDVGDLIDNLPDALQRADSFERWQLVEVIGEKLEAVPEELETWRRSVTSAAFKCLIASYSQSRDQAAVPSEQEQGILGRLQTLLTSAEDVTASEWNGFVKNGLKYRYRDHHFLNTLTGLLDLIYGGTEVQKELIPLPTLHMMASSHSLFLPTMLEEDLGRDQAKEALVSLLLSLVKKCPSVCNASHFVVFLGAYGATLSLLDQKLLLLLQEYERNQVSLLKFQSFLWGPAAVEHHKTRTSLGASLWKQASSDDILALLKPEHMRQTVAHFPQHRKLFPQEGKQLYSNDEMKDTGKLYDPCFLLPLFSAILQPECVVDCSKFVSSHALGFAVVALSSYDAKVRAAAYHVLSCFYQHLEAARFKEKRQLLYLMDMVRNGIQRQNQRLPSVMSTYISKVAQQMLKPEDHMYVVLNRFLLSHQRLDFRRIPEFFKLFYGFDLEHKVEREWILSVMEEGIGDAHCYGVCEHQGIFHSLLAFGSSPLRDDKSQMQIIRVLSKAATVNKAAYNLTKTYGVLTWMIQMVEKRNRDPHLLRALIDLLHVLWFTNLGQKEKPQADEAPKSSSSSSSAEEKPQSSVKCLPLPLITEFLCVTLTFCKYLSSGVKAAQLRLLLQTLCSVLKHRGTAFRARQQAERFTLHPQPLSSAEVLSLLLCWASLSSDKALAAQIQALIEKCKAKELLGLGKDRFRTKGSFSQSRAHKEKLADDAEAEREDEKSSLTECKFYLGSIFLHWEPAVPPSEPPPVQPGEVRLDLGQLATATAHLLAKWSLRSLAEDPYDEQRTEDFLLWVEKAVMKREETVAVVLLDVGLKADLLRLYHGAFEAPRLSGRSGKVETLQRFTDIMSRLLETRGQLPEVHQAVVSACRPEATQHPSRCEAGLHLLSLYIHEIWSGAASAELFLSHVQLVTKSGGGGKRKTAKTAQSAIVAICTDIISGKRS